MSSFLDSLQLVQTHNDNIYQHNPKPNFQQTSDQHSSNDQNQQNTHLKVSSSTKPSILLSSSHSHKQRTAVSKNTSLSKNSTKQENKNQKHQNLSHSDDFRKFNFKNQFSCQNCSYHFNSNCQICKGKTKLNGNDKIIKFFEYVLEFKLGKKQSYRNKEEKRLTKRNQPNQHCNIYFSTVNPKISLEDKPHAKVRFSINNDDFRDDSIIQEEQVRQCKDIHLGFNCDQCEMEPIKGLRYHCKECGNYDLCQKCFLRFGHRHQLQKIEPKANKKAFDIISHLLKNGNSSSLKSSLRNSSSFRNSEGNKTCKSWIR